MATTHRSDLVEQLEKALTDEAYDGGNGALSDEQFTKLVRKLADTAIAVFGGVQMSADELGSLTNRLSSAISAGDEFDTADLRDLILCVRRLQGEPSDEPRPLTLEDLSETSTSLDDLIGEARSEGVWCCESGCGSGACESCPCCSAGWCVSGIDGVPDDVEDRERWLEVAAEYNPVVAALRAAEGVR